MDKNTIIGFILIAAVLIGFSIMNKPSEEETQKAQEQKKRDAIEYAQTQQDETSTIGKTSVSGDGKRDAVDGFFDAVQARQDSVLSEDFIAVADSTKALQLTTLENDKVKLSFSTKGGQIVSAQLKDYKSYTEEPLYVFDSENEVGMDLLLTNKAGQTLKTGNLNFEPIPTSDKGSLIMRFAYSPTQYIDFVYVLSEDDYMLKFDVNMVGMHEMLSKERADVFELQFYQKMRRLETNVKREQQFSSIYYKYDGDDVKDMDAKGELVELKEPTKWLAFKNQFFASVLIADSKMDLAILESKALDSEDYLKSCDAHVFVSAEFNQAKNSLHAGFSRYIGPMSYTHLKSYDSEIKDSAKQLDLDKLVPLGWALFRWINQYFVIPLFNILKSSGLGMGIVILLLTIIVKLIISPLTYKSFMSSAKMRVLRPEVEAINAKYPKPEQMQEKQREVMSLYSQAGASPMSGCVPMLLQMPILIALFQFFPNAIELRHQSFLWAKDLSTYDAIASLPEGLPLIGGLHLSLFCILMTVTNIVYTKFNMDATNTGQQQMPGMKWMMYLMPLIFFFVLNDFPSGLTYYYFISLLITILLTLLFRFIVDEEKVLAKLESNKKKPKKKGGFMARIEEAQRLQEQKLKTQNKKSNKKR